MGGEDEARASTPLNLTSLEWFLARGTRTCSTSKTEPRVRIGPLSRTARLLVHTNTKISSILIINYSTKMGDLLALQNALANLNL